MKKKNETWADAGERNGVLPDKVIPYKLVIEDDETDESHFGLVDVKFQALLKNGTISFIRNRPRFLLCEK